jgi:hypothetical protein
MHQHRLMNDEKRNDLTKYVYDSTNSNPVNIGWQSILRRKSGEDYFFPDTLSVRQESDDRVFQNTPPARRTSLTAMPVLWRFAPG